MYNYMHLINLYLVVFPTPSEPKDLGKFPQWGQNKDPN